MKILFVNNFRARGGGEEFLRDLLPGLVAQGMKVGLLCRPQTPLAEMFENSEVSLHPIKRSGLSNVSSVWKTAGVIRDNRYDVIAVQRGHDIIQSWLGMLVSGRNIPLTYTVQVPEFVRSRFLLGRMSRIVTISRYIRDKILSFSPATGKHLSIIHYGIDVEQFRPVSRSRGLLRQRWSIPAGAPVIGTVGDLWKNQIEFLDALVLIKHAIPGVRFALAAAIDESESSQRFNNRVVELGLSDSLIRVGRLSRQEIRDFYADIDMAVSTHRNEGFGIWVLEALAMGCPVVAVNEGGVRDSLEDCPAGILVAEGPDAMAQAVLNVLQNGRVRQSMSDAGPVWIRQRFTRQRMIEEYALLFRSLT